MLTIATIIESVPARDIDSHIDTIIPPLIKKAADTNLFLSESAVKALTAACHMLSE
jgi:hypothetical protein